MNHLPLMIYDLTVILAAAAISTLLFSRLKQPIVLGYLIAGFAVGPHFSFFPTVTDTDSVKLWAEIGVIFLLFNLGLEFSFKKLSKVGKSASLATIFEIITVSAMGYLLGRVMGWNSMDSLFLGAALSISSTTIIFRAFKEAKLKGKGFVNLVFGILIVEDLMAILLIVLLTAISIPGSFSGSNFLYLAARLAFFLLIWFLVGIYILPNLLNKIRKHLTDEIMLVVSVALCLLMVVLSTNAELSPALGAFIMGSILAETDRGSHIEHLLLPVRDLFAAVFFVSVGMLIDPNVLREHFLIVILITVVTIVSKLLGSGFGSLLSGRSLKQSFQAGMSLAQIGEFSFIIAALGTSLNATSAFLYPIIIVVSAITTFTTPYMIRYSEPLYFWLEARLPKRVLSALKNYELALAVDKKESLPGLLWRIYGLTILLNSVVVVAVTLLTSRFLLPILSELFGDEPGTKIFSCVITFLASSPFLLAIMVKTPKKISTEEGATLLQSKGLQLGILSFRFLTGLSLITLIISQYNELNFLLFYALLAAAGLLYLLKKFINPLYTIIESRFLLNLNAKAESEIESLIKPPQLIPWNANLMDIIVSSNSKVAGQTLEELKFRTVTGATIVMIDRGRRRILAPSRSERLMPGDQLFLIGTDEQLVAAQTLLENEHVTKPPLQNELFSLESVFLEKDSPYCNKSIREVGVGEEFGGLIVGIERSGNRMLNPESNVVLQSADLIWVFGHHDRIRQLKRMGLIESVAQFN